MNDLKDLLKFLMGFISWILFLFLSGETFPSLERAIIICLAAGIIFGYKQLRDGFILQWGTVIFFAVCAVTVNLLHMIDIAKNMGIIANGFLAAIIWLTIFIGKPFTLQYARVDLPRERWNDPQLMRSCRFIAVVWGALMTFSTAISCFRALKPGSYPEWVYACISIGTIIGGTIFTQAYKKYKRSQRA